MKVANIIIFISFVIFVCSAAIANASSRIVLQLNARIPASIEINQNKNNSDLDFDIKSNTSSNSIRVNRRDESHTNHRIYTVTVN